MLAQPVLNKNRVVVLALTILLTGTPLLVHAAQITPNPNPAGSTIDIVNDPLAVNTANPFVNVGIIHVDSTSILTNSAGAVLNNYYDDPNFGHQGGTLNTAGILNNYGDITNFYDNSSLTNSGTLNNFAGASLTNLVGATLTNTIGATLNNYGSVGNGIDAARLVNNGTLNNYAGALLCNCGGPLGSAGVRNTGILNNFSGATFISGDAAPVFNSLGGMLNNYGTMITDQARFHNNGMFNNAGFIRTFLTELNNFEGATLINSGEIMLSTASVVNNAGTFINTGSVHGFFDPSTAGVWNSGLVINTGVLDLAGYVQSAGQTINNGTITASTGSVGIQGGSLRGTGIINGPVSIASGATLSPGDTNTLGTFTINGDLHSNGNMLFRIGGVSTGQFDVLAIHGHAFLNGGTVGFNFMNFTPVAGNSWDFLYAGALNGWENLTFSFSGLSPDLTYAFNYSNGVQTLRVVSVPEPDSFILLVLALGGLVLWRRLKSV